MNALKLAGMLLAAATLGCSTAPQIDGIRKLKTRLGK